MLNHLLTDQELDFVLELLKAESTKLMMETRHTDARELRSALRERLRTTDRLIERFQQIKEGTLTP